MQMKFQGFTRIILPKEELFSVNASAALISEKNIKYYPEFAADNNIPLRYQNELTVFHSFHRSVLHFLTVANQIVI